ncbi:MAG: hypothetical protein OEX22_05755 [Cyclobacteriaceae bacterium]|nr:hypothetical protein [Cyclobacteriaceae bacterium]
MIKCIRCMVLFSVITALFFSCNKPNELEEGHHEDHQTLRSKLDAMSVDSITYSISTDEFLKDLKKVLAEVPDSEFNFYVPERSAMIKSYPCSNCHSKPLDELQKLGEEEIKKAHWNIKVKHADAEVMECATCHNDNNLDELQSLTNKGISLNHSYQLCGQCHSTQYKDWQGGAHGKRLGGWTSPRVVNSCVNCHNPHSPAFESKWPARLNTVKLKQQSSD